jgi:hypothetical protein
MASMKPVLPPKLSGQVRGEVTIQITHFSSPDWDQTPDSELVRVLWWGQDHPEEIRIPKSLDSTIIKYDVVTAEKHFRNYLKDAEKLFFEIVCNDERVGFAVVDDLVGIVDLGGLTRTLEVFDNEGEIRGEIDVQLEYQNLESDIDDNRGKHHVDERSHKSAPAYRPPTKRGSVSSRTTSNLSVSSREKGRARSLPTTPLKQKKPHPRQRSMSRERPRVTFSDSDAAPNTFETIPKEPSISKERDLKRVLLRSRARLEATSDLRSKAGMTSSDDNKENQREVVAESVTPKQAKANGLLPSWNLSTSRLRFISTVTQLLVNVHFVSINSKVLKSLQEDAKRPKLVLHSRGNGTFKSLNGTGSSNNPISYFVSFTIPPSTMSTNFCSRKITDSTDIIFNQKHVQTLAFKPELLDSWWTTDLEIKFLTRSMKQRVPTLVGSASIGLKYLLTDSRNSNGDVLRLPIYAGQMFAKEHKLDSEIIGDLHISFLLGRAARSTSGNENARFVSPQRAVRDGDVESEKADEHRSQEEHESSNFENVPLKRFGDAHPVSTMDDASDHLYDSVDDTSEEVTRDMFCFLKISEGRNFALDSKAPKNLYIYCRFMTSTDVVRSQISWNSTRPKFNVAHYVPVRLDKDFLRRCKDNFLVVEVWNHDRKSKIVGVAMVPLQQFYLSFKVTHI